MLGTSAPRSSTSRSGRFRGRSIAIAAVMAASVMAPLGFGSAAHAAIDPAGPWGLKGSSTQASTTLTAAPGVSATLSVKPKGAKQSAKQKAAKKAKKAKQRAKARSQRIIALARKYDGGYYRAGGTTPAGFDCSGYTRYVFAKMGRSLPHNSAAQRAQSKRVSRSNARVGDLIFFHSSSGHVYHVGIFAGHGKLYHSSTPGKRVGLGPIFSSRVSFGRV